MMPIFTSSPKAFWNSSRVRREWTYPFIFLVLNPWDGKLPPVGAYYWQYLLSGKFISSSGPMWFAFALLVICFVLAGWRILCRPPIHEGPPLPAPTTGRILLFALVLGLLTFAVRLFQPLGTSVLNMQLCYFVQYIAAFTVGLWVSRQQWLEPLARSIAARRAGWCALIFGPLLLTGLYLVGVSEGAFEKFEGGWHWQALALAMLEQFSGVGLALGVLALFSTRMDKQTPLLRWLSDRSFAVYVLHAPVVVALFMLYRRLPQQPYLLALLLATSGLVVTYLMADAVRRIPGFRDIL